MTVLEVQRWADNAQLIQAMFDMHVWPKPWAQDEPIQVLDPTYGRGKWWEWSDDYTGPEFDLHCHDVRMDGVDYRHLPYGPNTFDVVIFDPDYVAPGGRPTSTIKDFNDRYGLTRDYESPHALQQSIDEGIQEICDKLKPQGIGMVKTMNYISSGKLWLGEFYTIDAIHGEGCVIEDIVVHLGGTGPQPEHKTQKHVRSNSSRLLIFRKPGRRTSRKQT